MPVIDVFSTVKINFNLKCFGSMVTYKNCLLKGLIMSVEKAHNDCVYKPLAPSQNAAS